MHCSNCGHILATDDKFCTGCGRPIAVIPVKKKKTHPLVALLAVVLFVGAVGAIINGATRRIVTDPSSRAQEAESGERTARAANGGVMLKNATRNPDSFKLSSALFMPTGTVCYLYLWLFSGPPERSRLHSPKGAQIKTKNEWVHSTHWDCVILDEYHYGSWRDNAKELFEAEDKKEAEFGEGEGIEYFDEDEMPITADAYPLRCD